MKSNFSKIEAKWQKVWQKKGVYEPNLKGAKKPFYNLMMFPYPSAEGLHIGSARTFTGIDIYGRFKRMQGYDVLEPIGLDGFGIHSENYAMKIGRHPFEHAKISEKNFYRQLAMMSNGFAWKEKVETYDPEYYRWTQWIFTQLFKQGLAYRKKQAVNWCPSCKTVLSDEQVIAGKCERCSSVVVKKELEQWFFRITAYADRLLKNLDKLDWSENIKIAQRNWIGKSEGAEITFRVTTKVGNETRELDPVTIFTTRPDTIFGATYLVLAPEHPLLAKLEFGLVNKQAVDMYVRASKAKPEEERIAEGGEKSGIVLVGIKAINPATNEEIPIWIADYVLGHYGTGAIMAVPAHDKRDFEFAKKFKLPIKKVVTGPSGDHEEDHTGIATDFYEGEGVLINSGTFNSLATEKARWDITTALNGKRATKYRLRDWLISRQRYWSPPIPMIFCPRCADAKKSERTDMPGWYTVPDKQLPVKLPRVKEFKPTGTGHSPLAAVKSFYEVRCPGCKGKARRETDVSDTFLDSAWYFLRYPSAHDKKHAWDPAMTKRWLPVTSYIGGAEHAVLHLLYSRFLTMAMKDAKHLTFEEPFTKFRTHGLITKDGAKMSKSKGNVVNPDEYFKKFGADVMRTYLAFLAPLAQGGDFRDQGILGITRFLERVWRIGELVGNQKGKSRRGDKRHAAELVKAIHRTVKKVTEDIEKLQYNTAISALMNCLNDIEERRESIQKKEWEMFLKLLAPFSPYITEELWQTTLKHKSSIHCELWPKYDARHLVEKDFSLIIQINGKTRHTIRAPQDVTEAEATKRALAEERVKGFLNGGKPRRVIYVPGRLINFVI